MSSQILSLNSAETLVREKGRTKANLLSCWTRDRKLEQILMGVGLKLWSTEPRLLTAQLNTPPLKFSRIIGLGAINEATWMLHSLQSSGSRLVALQQHSKTLSTLSSSLSLKGIKGSTWILSGIRGHKSPRGTASNLCASWIIVAAPAISVKNIPELHLEPNRLRLDACKAPQCLAKFGWEILKESTLLVESKDYWRPSGQEGQRYGGSCSRISTSQAFIRYLKDEIQVLVVASFA